MSAISAAKTGKREEVTGEIPEMSQLSAQLPAKATPLVVPDLWSLLSSGDVFRTGATLGGYPVTELRILTTDTREQVIQLPAPVEEAEGEEDDPIPLNNYQRRIVALMASRDQNDRLVGESIAKGIRENYVTIRKHLAGLVQLEVFSNDNSKDGYGRGANFGRAVTSLAGG